ncbi:MAG: hypothetical protein ACK4MV_16600 [Beijerinckiaceae bacterium]
MNIRMLQTVEDQIKAFLDVEAAETPAPLNEIAARSGGAISRTVVDDMAHINCHMPAGGEFTVGARQGKRLVDLGYAEELK